MAARLGNVLFWVFTGIAMLLAGVAVYYIGEHLAGYTPNWLGGRGEIVKVNLIAAGTIHLLGRACRYVLAGRF